ncbi:MAG: glucose-6-phosphate isomerase, partial [Bacteroidales bacterium]|nr:glucose-6-phosphate isomerase [Bacteroidales bacterium]
MKHIQVDLKNALSFIDKNNFNKYYKLVKDQDEKLVNKTGKGSDFLGWVNLPNIISNDLISEINETAKQLREKSDVIVIIGIGGSYLGAKAVIEALSGQFDHLKQERKNPSILFAGQNLSEDYHYELLNFLKDKKYSLVVISKSGTTTEPAIAFRLLRKDLENRFGKQETSNRIIAITDASKGALRNMAEQENYKSFIIDDDIGGRYSVLTPVGLLPIACAGYNIEELLNGAKTMLE